MKQNNINAALERLNAIEQPDAITESMRNMLRYLKANNIKGWVTLDDNEIIIPGVCDMIVLTTIISFDKERKCMRLRGRFPMNCHKDKRSFVGELITRINFGIVLGSFDFDMTDGECAFRYSHYIGDTTVSEDQAERAFMVTVSTVSKYEHTLAPLFLGNEPDEQKSCMEYDLMKLSEHIKSDSDTPSAFDLFKARIDAERRAQLWEALSESVSVDDVDVDDDDADEPTDDESSADEPTNDDAGNGTFFTE